MISGKAILLEKCLYDNKCKRENILKKYWTEIK